MGLVLTAYFADPAVVIAYFQYGLVGQLRALVAFVGVAFVVVVHLEVFGFDLPNFALVHLSSLFVG